MNKDNVNDGLAGNGYCIMRNTIYLGILSCFVFTLLVTGQSLAQNENKGVSYLDLGYYKIYRFTESEIQKLNDRQLTDVLRIYADRFYPFYMFLSRNYFSPMLEQNYSVLSIESVFQKIEKMTEAEKRQKVQKIYFDPNGVVEQNKDLYIDMRKMIGDIEAQKFGKMLTNVKGIEVHAPAQILQAYQFKLGLLAKQPLPSFLDAAIDFMKKFKIYFLIGLSTFFVGILLSFLNGKTNKVR